jgi:hypothetical protein
MRIKLSKFIRIQRLHLFTDDTDTFVAYDRADAVEAWKEHYGENERDRSYDDFEQIPDAERLTIGSEPADFEATKKTCPLFSKIDDGEGKEYPSISAPAWAWALNNGRGFLCSTEW